VVWSLLGAVFLILGGGPTRAQLEQELVEEKELLKEAAGAPATQEAPSGG
jgi:hypothetical protein